MAKEQVVYEYYRILEERDYDALMSLFSKEAVVDHPIFGVMPATEFFKILLDRAQKHQIEISDIMRSTTKDYRVAAFIYVTFFTKDNTKFEEKSVHIFDFDESDHIQKISAILDTFHFRDKYTNP